MRSVVLSLLLVGAGCVPMAEASSPELPGYDGRFAGDPTLAPDEVALLGDAALRVLRNEVFAQYGRAFSSSDLQEHFKKTSWYKEDPSFSEDRLTANDKANVALLSSLEGDRRASQRKVGEYAGDGYRLLLVSETDCEVVLGDDLYDWESIACKWESRGQWVVTYTDGAWPKPAGKVYLWGLDDGGAKVTKRLTVGEKQG